MKTLKLIDYLSTFYPLSDPFKSALDKVLLYKRLKKGIILTPTGKTPSIWFINSGLAKGSYLDTQGKEHVSRFWQQGEVMLIAQRSPRSVLSADQIVLLEDSQLTTISASSAVYLYHSFTETPKLSSKILLNDRNKADLKSFLCSLPSDQAYQQFEKLFPAQRLLQRDIASYLQLSPGRLSEIRKNSL